MTFPPSTVLQKGFLPFLCWTILKMRSLRVGPYHSLQPHHEMLGKRSVMFVLKIYSEKGERQMHTLQQAEFCLGIRRKSSDRTNSQTLGQVPHKGCEIYFLKNYSGFLWERP